MGKTNSKKIGNRFQQDFENSIPVELYYHRPRDMKGAGFKSVENEGDYLVNQGKFLLILELKTTAEHSLPLKNIRMAQIWKMMCAVVKKNTFGGLLVEFRVINQTYFIPISEFVYWYLKQRHGESVPLTWIKEHGYKVSVMKLITRSRYGVAGILSWVEDKQYVNN